MQANSEKWLNNSKLVLDWFIETMGEGEWIRRRQNVVNYFRDDSPSHEDHKRIAVYSDWLAWYMYLIESVFERPGCGEPAQLHRIQLFFAVIGNQLNALKAMTEVNAKMKVIVNEKQNQPDDTLFELAVALMYHRNGWIVEFVKENNSMKSPDLKVTKGEREFWVECKRLAKNTEYGEKERSEWMKRSKHLSAAMDHFDKPAFVKITFKVPVHETPEIFLAQCYFELIKKGLKAVSTSYVDMSVEFLDMEKINSELAKNDMKQGSPEMFELLTGEYDVHGQYGMLLGVAEGYKHLEENPLSVLNITVSKLHKAYVFKWECIATESIDRKSKDFLKILSNATKQIPETGKGIIQIGYETLDGPAVEKERQRKTQQLLRDFHFSGKQVEAVFFNSMQFLSTPGGFDWAQTTMYFQNEIIIEGLLLDTPEGDYSNSTHWEG
jgi:hypothetical protein